MNPLREYLFPASAVKSKSTWKVSVPGSGDFNDLNFFLSVSLCAARVEKPQRPHFMLF